MQVHQNGLWIACWLLQVCFKVIPLNVKDNLLLCCGLQISTWKLCCMWLVLISICCLCYLHLPVVCSNSILLFQLLEVNNSISWLCNIHHRLLVLWYSISIQCQWMCVKGKLLEILFHHVPGIVVLHRSQLMHMHKLCSISSDVDSVRLVLGWMIPWVLRKCCDGLVSTQILLVDELIVLKLLLFGKVLDEFPVVSYKSKECMYLFWCFWQMDVLNCLCFQWRWFFAFCTKYMS